MRKILFRGKRVDNGEWISGYLVNRWYKTYIAWDMTNKKPSLIEVIPETVGQYIAKHKIYTGDICEVYDGDDLMYKGTVSWCEDCTSYLLTDNYVNWDGMQKTNDVWLDGFADDCWKFKVIGNIHDKPNDDYCLVCDHHHCICDKGKDNEY